MRVTGVVVMVVCAICSTSAFGDYILRDVVGGGATEGTAANTETRMPGSVQDFLASEGGFYDVEYVGGGRYNLYSNGILEGYVIDLDSDEQAAVSPSEGAIISVSSLVRGTVLRQSSAASGNGGVRVGRNGAFRADVFYNTFETDFVEGTTIGLTPSIVIGDTVELAIRIPLQMTDVDGVDEKLYHYGADASLTINLSDYFAIGAHAAYSRDEWEDGGDAEGYINGGPYISVLVPLGEASLTLGGLFEYGTPEDSKDGEESMLVVGGANLGLPLGDALGVNIFGLYYYHIDSALSDFNFIDAGAELAMTLGDTWAVQIGGRTILGLDAVDSYEAYVGSEWAF